MPAGWAGAGPARPLRWARAGGLCRGSSSCALPCRGVLGGPGPGGRGLALDGGVGRRTARGGHWFWGRGARAPGEACTTFDFQEVRKLLFIPKSPFDMLVVNKAPRLDFLKSGAWLVFYGRKRVQLYFP